MIRKYLHCIASNLCKIVRRGKFLALTRSLRNANVRPCVRPVQTCLVGAAITSSCSINILKPKTESRPFQSLESLFYFHQSIILIFYPAPDIIFPR